MSSVGLLLTRTRGLGGVGEDHPRKGSPAPWIAAEAWQRTESASEVICGRDDRLNVDKVPQIRPLVSGGVSAGE